MLRHLDIDKYGNAHQDLFLVLPFKIMPDHSMVNCL
jgi:hypothetical protein